MSELAFGQVLATFHAHDFFVKYQKSIKNTRFYKDFKEHFTAMESVGQVAKYNANPMLLANICPSGQKLAKNHIKAVLGQDLATFTHMKIMKNQKKASTS